MTRFDSLFLVLIFVVYLRLSLGFELKGNLEIIGGRDASIEEVPYQLSVQVKHTHICGASIIDPKWVVTAAQCTNGLSAEDLFIRAGTPIMEKGGQLIGVKEIHQHSKYSDFTLDYDLSILELLEEITIGSTANVVPLPDTDYVIPVGSTGIISGWGSKKENGEPSTQLQLAEVPIVSHGLCKKLYDGLINTITDRMLCAGNVDEGGVDSCKKDSGGPLVVEGKLCGVISWGTGCGRPFYPGVYTNLTSLRGFIKDVTGI